MFSTLGDQGATSAARRIRRSMPTGRRRPIAAPHDGGRRAPPKAPEAKEFFNKLVGDPYPGDHTLVAKLQAQETTAWREYVKLAKIEPM